MNFYDIKQLPKSGYRADIPWWGIERFLSEQGNVILEPDFQREHVWNKTKQTKYIEWILSGGASGKDIYFNCSTWMRGFSTPMILVDGLQRLSAVREFLHNEVVAFGKYFSEFGGKMDYCNHGFVIHVANLKTRRDVLEWYIALNKGGVVHSNEEIERVRLLLRNTAENETI